MAAAAAPPAPTAITVPAAFKNLVKVLANMFYSAKCPPDWWVDAADPKKGEGPDADRPAWQERTTAQLAREAKRKQQQDTTGLGVILLTALTEVQWVEEDELARSLNLPPKMVRRGMRYLEQEQLVQREHRKESVRHRKQERDMMVKAGLRQGPAAGGGAAKPGGAAAAGGGGGGAAAGGGQQPGGGAAAAEEEGEDGGEALVSRGHIITYVALDYPRILDSVRWRLATIKRKLQAEIKNDNAVQTYRCSHPKCGKEFTSMDVFQLMPAAADLAAGGANALSCSICGSEIKMTLDEGGRELGSMEDKKERQRRARALLLGMDAALAPLTSQLSAVEGIHPPDFNTYATWLHNQVAMKQRLDAIAAQAAAAGSSKRSSNAPAPMFDANTRVVVNFGDSSTSNGGGPGSAVAAAAGGAAAAAVSRGAAAAAGGGAGGGAPKPLPPWMAKAATAHLPQQQQQQQAAKPIPPWLMSAHRQAAAAGGVPLQPPGGLGLLGSSSGTTAIKPEGAGGVKPDPGGIIKAEGIKDDPGFLQGDLDDAEWEDVGAGGGAADTPGLSLGGSGATGGSGEGGLLAAVLDEDEDWEDV